MTQSQPTVAIAGGGLAGLAAACALSDAGFRVTLFEKRPFLGGRASSYEHPGTGEVVDNCQHVLFRVCTNLVKFYEHIGVADQIRWFDQMNFVEPGGRISVMKSSPLPAPLHTAPSFLRFPFLSVDRQAGDHARAGPIDADGATRQRTIIPAMARCARPNEECRRALLASHPDQRSQRGTRPYFRLRRGPGRARIHEDPRRAPHGRAHSPAHRPVQRRGRLRSHARRDAPFPLSQWRASPLTPRRSECACGAATQQASGRNFRLSRPRASLRCSRVSSARGRGEQPDSRADLPLRELAHHRHPSLVRPPDLRSRSRGPARPHHPVDVPQIPPAADADSN